jgi:SEC-C motif
MTEASPSIGRNEPCPCGSGKKYKRCCGVNAAPKLSTPSAPQGPAGAELEALKNQFDPQMMTQFAQMMGRLPKGQLQKLQSIMQRAMAGKDVTQEAKIFEQSLPMDLQSLLSSFQMPADLGGLEKEVPSEQSSSMSEIEARQIIEAAAKEGKISSEEAQQLLVPGAATAESQEKGKFSKLWKKISGK